MVVDRTEQGGRTWFRRGCATAGLGTLATLFAAHRIAAAPYFGAGGQQIATDEPSNRTTDTQPPAMTIDVREFGARGDGVTDDAPAINAAIRAARERQKRVDHLPIGCRIVFPMGIYAVDSSIDLTGLQALNTVIDGGASAILGRCQGKPVLDALGSRWLTIRDLTVMGDPAAVPGIGIQIGRIAPRVVADDHRFDNVKVLGHFGLACLYNRAAETTAFDHLLLWNEHPGSYCLIQDGVNDFDVTSSFAAVNLPPDADLSFNENVFINCDFRHGAGGIPVWLGDTARHAFIRCYAATGGGPAFVIHCGQNSHSMLDVDCHCETEKLADVFLFTGKTEHMTVRGFSYRDHECFASNAVFRCDEHITHVELQNARLEIAGFANPRCKVFAQPERWKATGSYYTSSAGSWNGAEIFTGMVTIGSTVTFSGALRVSPRADEIEGRPNLGPVRQGTLFRDKVTNQLLIWTGSRWVDAQGNAA